MVLFTYSSSNEEFDMQEGEDISMILFLHLYKKPGHGGSVFIHVFIWRRRIDADNKLMLNYFVDSLVYPERYFGCYLMNYFVNYLYCDITIMYYLCFIF
jgi:hypothetical protein